MNNDCYEFYYEMMPATERIVYRAMYAGFINSEDIFSIPKCEYGKISEIFEKLTDDHPEIFYVKSIRIQSRKLLSGCHIIPQYRFTRDEIYYINAEVEKQASPIICRCIGESAIDAEKLIHDYLIEKVTYKDLDAPYSHEMPGVILYGIGVCEGVAKAFKYLCDKVGIRSGIVVGNAKGESVVHAWNQVCVDGDWYNVDVTFDANLTNYSGDIRYDYFNVADYELSDRESFFSVPLCNKYYSFYVKKRKYARCQRDLKDMIRKRTGEIISVQIPKMNCTEKQLQEYLFKTVSDSLLGFEKHEINICPNFNMNVFTIKIVRIGLI